jgi:hypothetical protein
MREQKLNNIYVFVEDSEVKWSPSFRLSRVRAKELGQEGEIVVPWSWVLSYQTILRFHQRPLHAHTLQHNEVVSILPTNRKEE